MWRSCSGLARTRVCSKASASCVRRFGSEAYPQTWLFPKAGGGWRDGAPSGGDDTKELERLLAIQVREYGPDHIEIAPALFNLGKLHVALGDKAKAREFIARALAIAERTYGSDHPRTNMCREYLAGLSS